MNPERQHNWHINQITSKKEKALGVGFAGLGAGLVGALSGNYVVSAIGLTVYASIMGGAFVYQEFGNNIKHIVRKRRKLR